MIPYIFSLANIKAKPLKIGLMSLTKGNGLTDVITYKVYWNGTSGSNMYLNRLYDDSDSANYVRVASSMTAMEID